MPTRRKFLAAIGATALCAAASAKSRRVTIGICSRDVAAAAKFGFDYVEPAAADIAAMSDDDFRQFRETVLSSRIRCHAFNSFIRRKDLVVVGEHVAVEELRKYMEECLARCRSLGASVVVWGSAGSRNVPPGFSRDRANEQIAGFLHLAGDIARQHEIVVAIEPLRRQESNILNTGAETLRMVRRVKHPNVRMIIDYFHLREEHEDLRILETARREIVHLHFANPHGRLWPHTLTEDDQYGTFFRLLKEVGYAGGISIEGRGSFEKDASASRAFFRQALGFDDMAWNPAITSA
jgi:D-psicose/D-tagatose/L-ribulose 3-epimerase